MDVNGHIPIWQGLSVLRINAAGRKAYNPEFPGSTPTASFGLSFACATNQINNLQQERQIV
jgi:hypothetical protein